MTASSKTTIKSYFQTGDKPTQAQFSDLIDSYIDTLSAVGNAQTLAVAGGTGLINIISSASATLTTTGAVGLQVLSAATTAAAQQALGGGTVGRNVFQAATTAAALNQLGASAVGTQVLQAATTAAAVNALGAGAVGAQLFSVATTAAAQNIVGAGGITLGTPTATTTGSTVNYAIFPAGTKRITINFAGVSISSTDDWTITIGPVGGLETSGYNSTAQQLGSSSNNISTAFLINLSVAAANLYTGRIVLELLNASTNLWVASGALVINGTTNPTIISNGQKAIAGTLTQIQLNVGAATLDAGSMNVTYET